MTLQSGDENAKGLNRVVKAPYHPPRLTIYGDLRRITMGEKGKARIDTDPGPSSTKR
jgi:hypothetical protein